MTFRCISRTVLVRDHPFRSLCRLGGLAALLLCSLAARAAGNDVALTPAMTVGEEYNDNIFLEPDAQVSDYITHIIPSLKAEYASSFWKWSLDYSYDRRVYDRNSFLNDSKQRAFLESTAHFFEDRLFFDVRDSADKTSLTIVRDYTQEGPVQHQTQYNAVEVNPYAVLQLSSRTTLTAGYQYRNLWFKDPAAIDRSVYSAYADLSRDLTERIQLLAHGRKERVETAVDVRRRSRFLIGARYEYRASSYLWGTAGMSRTVDESGSTVTHPVWDAGWIHQAPRVTLRCETGRSWVDDPSFVQQWEERYLAELRYRRERTSAGVGAAVHDYGSGPYLNERKYTSTADFSHYLFPTLEASYALTIDRYKHYVTRGEDTTTIVYLTDVRFAEHVSRSLTVSLNYRYTDSYSGNIYSDNYEVNRLLVELKKSF